MAKERCEDVYIYKGHVLCKAKKDCKHKSKVLVPTGNRSGIYSKTYSGPSMPRCEVKGLPNLESEVQEMKTTTEISDNKSGIENEIHIYQVTGKDDQIIGVVVSHYKQAKKDRIDIPVADATKAEEEIKNYLTSVEDLHLYKIRFEFPVAESLVKKLTEIGSLSVTDECLGEGLEVMLGEKKGRHIAIKPNENNTYTETKVKPPKPKKPLFWIEEGDYTIPVYEGDAK